MARRFTLPHLTEYPRFDPALALSLAMLRLKKSGRSEDSSGDELIDVGAYHDCQTIESETKMEAKVHQQHH